jgi:hypothetical protein
MGTVLLVKEWSGSRSCASVGWRRSAANIPRKVLDKPKLSEQLEQGCGIVVG